MAQPQVQVANKAPKKYNAKDLEFTQANPENLGKYADHEQIKKIMFLANQRAHLAIEAEQDMGLLDRDVRMTWPKNPEVAKRRTLGRRQSMNEWELALWEAYRNPRTGVPPADVISAGPGQPITVEN